MWKGILEEVFDDFLRFLSPKCELVLDLDQGIEFLDKELEQVFPPENDVYSPKVVDKLIKVFTRSGKEEWILVHVEVQGQYHHDFPQRMFSYYYRILDKYQKPVTAYAIFTEGTRKARPAVFEIAFLGTSVRYKFNTYKISSQSEEELRSSDNLFALVILIAKSALQGKGDMNETERDRLMLGIKIDLAKQLLVKQIGKDKVRALMNFLRYYVRFENRDYNAKFDEEVEILTERSTTMGIEELLLDMAKKEGKAEEKLRFVKNMMNKLDFSDQQIAEIADVTEDFVKDVRSRILDL